jgi:hypothetical protein
MRTPAGRDSRFPHRFAVCMAAACRLLLPLAVLVAALVAVHPVLGGIDGSEGEPAVGSAAKGPLVDVSNLAPGRGVRDSVTVANVGTAPGTFFLQASTGGSRVLAERLRLVVSREGRVLYEGSPAGFESVRLGRLAPAEERSVVVRVELPAAGGDELQGVAASLDLAVAVVGA